MRTEGAGTTACRICQNQEGNRTHIAREMMFGFRDRFEYLECADCGCLQLKEIPLDLQKYYPKDYYSFLPPPSLEENGSKLGKRKLTREFTRSHYIFKYLMSSDYVPGKLMHTLFPHVAVCAAPVWLIEKKLNLRLSSKSKILDIGCGNGELLLNLHSRGYKNLLGVDPFIRESIILGDGLRILKTDIEGLTGHFDFIMLHHSFEHMAEPLSVLLKLSSLLKPQRHLMIRIPLASSHAWRKYGVDWAQLDAPRHFFLHTLKSMETLAKKAGFSIVEVVFDSTEFQFWASEQYQRNIHFYDDRSYAVNPTQSMFSRKQIESFAAEASELNKHGEGDQACFFLTSL